MGFLSGLTEWVGDTLFTGMGGKASAKMNYDNQIKMYKEGPKAQVEGYKNAGLNPAMAMNSAGNMNIQGGTTTSGGISDLANSASNAYNTIKGMMNQDQQTENQTNLTEAQINNLKTQSAKNIEETKTIPQYLKNDTAKTTAQVQNINLQNEYQEKTMQARVSEQFGKAEQEVAKGDISANSAEFLAEYGITREEAITLGITGLQEINKLIMKGADLITISKKAKEMANFIKANKHSAKKIK